MHYQNCLKRLKGQSHWFESDLMWHSWRKNNMGVNLCLVLKFYDCVFLTLLNIKCLIRRKCTRIAQISSSMLGTAPCGCWRPFCQRRQRTDDPFGNVYEESWRLLKSCEDTLGYSQILPETQWTLCDPLKDSFAEWRWKSVKKKPPTDRNQQYPLSLFTTVSPDTIRHFLSIFAKKRTNKVNWK